LREELQENRAAGANASRLHPNPEPEIVPVTSLRLRARTVGTMRKEMGVSRAVSTGEGLIKT